jgi:predicted extracellular nuclease
MSIKNYTLLLTIVLFPTFAGAQCTDLFISEYIEGTVNNKYLEIYNPTSAAVNLASYDLQVF